MRRHGLQVDPDTHMMMTRMRRTQRGVPSKPSKMENKPRIVINISGVVFETFEETLSRFPSTLLGDKRRRRKHYCIKTKQYFLERNR